MKKIYIRFLSRCLHRLIFISPGRRKIGRIHNCPQIFVANPLYIVYNKLNDVMEFHN